MAGRRFAALPSRPLELLDCTSLTRDEWPPLVPPWEPACPARLAARRMEGKARSARRCVRRTSRKTDALPGVHGRLVGRGQGHAQAWHHGLVPVVRAARRRHGDAPPVPAQRWRSGAASQRRRRPRGARRGKRRGGPWAQGQLSSPTPPCGP